MAIGLLGALVGLMSAIASAFVDGISVYESCAIYLIMSSATIALSAVSVGKPSAAKSRT